MVAIAMVLETSSITIAKSLGLCIMTSFQPLQKNFVELLFRKNTYTIVAGSLIFWLWQHRQGKFWYYGLYYVRTSLRLLILSEKSIFFPSGAGPCNFLRNITLKCISVRNPILTFSQAQHLPTADFCNENPTAHYLRAARFLYDRARPVAAACWWYLHHLKICHHQSRRWNYSPLIKEFSIRCLMRRAFSKNSPEANPSRSYMQNTPHWSQCRRGINHADRLITEERVKWDSWHPTPLCAGSRAVPFSALRF